MRYIALSKINCSKWKRCFFNISKFNHCHFEPLIPTSHSRVFLTCSSMNPYTLFIEKGLISFLYLQRPSKATSDTSSKTNLGVLDNKEKIGKLKQFFLMKLNVWNLYSLKGLHMKYEWNQRHFFVSKAELFRYSKSQYANLDWFWRTETQGQTFLTVKIVVSKDLWMSKNLSRNKIWMLAQIFA